MSDFYSRVDALCKSRGVSITTLARSIGLSSSVPSGWKTGAVPRNSTLLKIAEYLNVSLDCLIDGESIAAFGDGEHDPFLSTKKQLAKDNNLSRASDADIKFALFGGDADITDAQYEEVKRFAQFVKERDNGDK